MIDEEPSQRTGSRDPAVAAAIDWFVRLKAEGGNPATASAFRAWSDADPAHAAAFAEVAAMWGAPELALAAGGAVTRARRKRRAAAATGAALVLMIGAGAVFGPGMWLRLNADHLTATGGMEVVHLPDGSVMTLNTASAVAIDFTDRARAVKLLAGEAHFDVASDGTRPFRVVMPQGTVTVTGTAFAVRDGDGADVVLLQRGAVTVSPRDGGGDVRLAPGEGVTVRAEGVSRPVRRDVDAPLAWLEGRLRFDAQPLAKVLAEIGRYRAGYVMVLDNRLADIAVSGDYRLEDPDQIIRSLAGAVGAGATFLPGGIVILR